MKILVGIKHVPDTETKVRVGPDGCGLDEAGVKWTMSPFDEYALKQALLIRDETPGEVVVVSAGRAKAQDSLRQGLAVGADRAVLIQDDRYDRADGLARAKALAALVQAEADVQLVLLGKYGVGTDEGQTGPMLAELLGWPHVSSVSTFELSGSDFSARREVEGAIEVQEGSLPAVISCEKGLNEPGYATLKGIMQAKRKPFESKTPAELGLDESDLGDAARLIWESMELPATRSGARMVEGAPEEAAQELARLLREEAKVI